MSLFFHIVRDGENPEQSEQNGQFFNANIQQQVQTNDVNATPQNVVQNVGNQAAINTAYNNVNTPVQPQVGKKQRVQSTFGKCAGSVIISLFIFAIAIYIFFGHSIATLYYNFSGLKDLKAADLFKQSGVDSLLLKLVINYCWVAFVYGLLSFVACILSVKDSFRKRFIPASDIKPYKILTSIFFIVFYIATYWIVLMNCNNCSKIINDSSFRFIESMIEESPYFTVINNLPIICCGIVTVFLILTLIVSNKTVNKKNAV